MLKSSSFISSLSEISFASFVESCDVNFEGNIKHLTFSGPSASTATADTKAESIPPDKPKTTFLKLFLVT